MRAHAHVAAQATACNHSITAGNICADHVYCRVRWSVSHARPVSAASEVSDCLTFLAAGELYMHCSSRHIIHLCRHVLTLICLLLLVCTECLFAAL